MKAPESECETRGDERDRGRRARKANGDRREGVAAYMGNDSGGETTSKQSFQSFFGSDITNDNKIAHFLFAGLTVGLDDTKGVGADIADTRAAETNSCIATETIEFFRRTLPILIHPVVHPEPRKEAMSKKESKQTRND